MIDHLFALYARSVDRFVVVVGPSALEAVARHCESAGVDVGLGVQPAPTGMLDAIVAASDEVRRTRPDAVWITWCDQVAVHPATVRRLAELADATSAPALVFPTATRRDPYTHLVRDGQGRITGVLQRREGDRLPEVGESDMGLFSLSADAYFEHLGRFAREAGTCTRRYLTDTVTALKLFRREVLASLRLESAGFELDHELTAKVLAAGRTIVEVPIRYFPRSRSEGKKIGLRDWFVGSRTFFRFRHG